MFLFPIHYVHLLSLSLVHIPISTIMAVSRLKRKFAISPPGVSILEREMRTIQGSIQPCSYCKFWLCHRYLEDIYSQSLISLLQNCILHNMSDFSLVLCHNLRQCEYTQPIRERYAFLITILLYYFFFVTQDQTVLRNYGKIIIPSLYRILTIFSFLFFLSLLLFSLLSISLMFSCSLSL